MTLKPGDAVPEECEQVGNFPFSILKDKTSLKTDPLNDAVRYKPPLAGMANTVEQTFIANELVICSKDFLPFGLNEPLKHQLRIEPEPPPPPPPPTHTYTISGWVQPHFFITENSGQIFSCNCPWIPWTLDGGGMTWDMMACSAGSIVTHPTLGCGFQYTCTAGFTINTGNFNRLTGEITGPLLTRFVTVFCKLTGMQVSFSRASFKGTESITYPMVRCPGLPFPYVYTAASGAVSQWYNAKTEV